MVAWSLTVTLLLAGDVMLGRGIDQIQRHSVDPVIYESYMHSAAGYVDLAEEKNGPIPRKVAPDYVWGDALAVVRRLDPRVRIINLETVVTTSDEPWPGKGIQYRMHPANTAVLTAARIDCASIANNHVLDWSRRGLTETLQSLHRAGIKTAGAGETMAETSTPAIFEVPGGRVLVFAMADESSGVPPSWGALSSRSGVHLLADLSLKTARYIAQEIKRIPRNTGDRVVASIHWGGNWGYEVSADQERFAHTLIDEGGVDVVFGHSSHHPKRVELYHKRLILYGAGDLINDYEGIGGNEDFRPELSLIYLPTLSQSGELQSLLLLPMRMERFRLNRTTNEQRDWLLHLLQQQSRGLELTASADGMIVARPR